MVTPADPNDLADAAIRLRYSETSDQVRHAILVLKWRGGAQERTIRDFRMESGGMHIGAPSRNCRDVFTGMPVLDTNDANLRQGSAP